ncbi:MAG: oligosaccharide flippase family protein [Hyphomicrobiales bacterium]|nr:oligosaccharide flippase family protein [Hyphomicrobiales bacterium]
MSMRIPIRYIVAQAPWALIATLSAGLANYVIVIILTKFYDAYVVGQFRLLLSVVGLLGLFSFLETGNILLKAVVENKGGVAKPLFVNRVKYALIGSAVGLVLAFYFYRDGNDIYIPLAFSALVVPVFFPTAMFEFINHALKNFRGNAIIDLTRFASVTLLFAAGGFFGVYPPALLSTYFVVLAGFNAFFYARLVEKLKPFATRAPKEIKDSVQLSLSSVFVNILEHADKLLISYVFGLKALGLYAVGVSTGNLVLFMAKPALTVLNPLLVEERFSGRMLAYIFVGTTIAGVIASVALKPIFAVVFGAEYLEAYDLSKVIIWGLGIFCVSVLVYNTSVYNKDSPVRVPVLNNFISPVIVLVYLVLAVLLGGEYALLLCAASYPLRQLVNVVILAIISGRTSAHAHV